VNRYNAHCSLLVTRHLSLFNYGDYKNREARHAKGSRENFHENFREKTGGCIPQERSLSA
jgi:hypothetical protein